jgi:hypothetical protein
MLHELLLDPSCDAGTSLSAPPGGNAGCASASSRSEVWDGVCSAKAAPEQRGDDFGDVTAAALAANLLRGGNGEVSVPIIPADDPSPRSTDDVAGFVVTVADRHRPCASAQQMTKLQADPAAAMTAELATGAGACAVRVASRTEVTLNAAMTAMNTANAASRTRLRRERSAMSSKRVLVDMVSVRFLWRRVVVARSGDGSSAGPGLRRR